MCDIAGYLSTSSSHPDLTQALHRMTEAIAHRGPDDAGYFESVTLDGRARVGLGHRRLSIIDLSTGHQPLGHADGSVQIVSSAGTRRTRRARCPTRPSTARCSSRPAEP